MAMDPDSELFLQLHAETPVTLSLTDLNERAGTILLEQLEAGLTIEAAITGSLNSLAKYAGKSVIALDQDRLFTGQPVIEEVVRELINEKGWTTGQAIARLVLDGAQKRREDSRPKGRLNMEDAVRTMGGYQNPDGTFTIPSQGSQPRVDIQSRRVPRV